MPKRTDIRKILIIGSGPIVIGQACEFDYSGTQACKALRADGYQVVLVNSNPATIMTDPEVAYRTYIEPLTRELLEQVIARERPDALLPTVGGQTGLNLAVELAEGGVLERYGIELIGASLQAIKVAEDRLWFKDACRKIGLDMPASAVVNNVQDALRLADQLGYPVVIRPSFTLGGTGGSIAYNHEEFSEAIALALDASPVHEAMVEESVLASKATGFPIAKIAARLAVGMTLDEIPNDITKKTPSCFEPTIDYVVVKIPKWQFEKFPGADTALGTQMKSVGEVMAIGRTFQEALCKGIRALEPSTAWRPPAEVTTALLRERLHVPGPDRIHWLFEALERGMSREEVCSLTKIDPWFIQHLEAMVEIDSRVRASSLHRISAELMLESKRSGASDEEIAKLWNVESAAVRKRRHELGVRPVFKRVDTCAAEFESFTPYLYSTYEQEDEAEAADRPKIAILGSGPNRIGQGIEFDYCCCHASFALREDGYEPVMANCNPETVSTDYDTSDRLYFEPLTLEDVLAVMDRERPQGVIVQFGGQTPLNLALDLKANGVPIIGTPPESIDLAEDRRRFGRLLDELQIPQPRNGTAF